MDLIALRPGEWGIRGMHFVRYIALIVATFVATTAHAAENESDAMSNVSLLIQTQLFRWGIWTTGVARLNNAELFGLAAVVMLIGFGVSGMNIILFKDRGVGFRLGWILSLPAAIGGLLGYCFFRPYPTMRDAATMFVLAGGAALGALIVGSMLKIALRRVADRSVRSKPRNAVLESRMKRVARN